MTPELPKPISTPLRILVDVALALLLAAGAGYWWLSPKGFPIGHSRFWLNSVIPVFVMVAVICGLVGVHRNRRGGVAVVLLCLASVLGAAAIAARILFPISFRVLWILGLLFSCVGIAFSVGLLRRDRKSQRWVLPTLTLSVLAGVFVVWAQLPPPASTNPLNELPPEVPLEVPESNGNEEISLDGGSRFDLAAAQLVVTSAGVRVSCSPLLEFDRISPDGFWSVLAPARWQKRTVSARTRDATAHFFQFSDNSTIVISEATASDTIRLTAYTPVDGNAFSHLNTFCHLRIDGHKQLSLTFSPCPDNVIEAIPGDYPTGRPARFAYLDASDRFMVVEASSGEKGPFRSLATGPMKRGEQLTLTLHDNSHPVMAITFDDWSQQASSALSPTAGWRVPMNAIEFQRLHDELTAPVTIWITLAATSVGRGWETVGHKAGIYRNRITVRTFSPL